MIESVVLRYQNLLRWSLKRNLSQIVGGGVELEFTPLEFETDAQREILQKPRDQNLLRWSLKQRKNGLNQQPRKKLEFTPLEFETGHQGLL